VSVPITKKVVAALGDNPAVFTFLRRILENNYKGEKRVIAEEMRVSEGEHVLDIACGTGDFSILFGSETYTGIDINARYIEFARNRYARKFLVMDAERMDFADQSFDYVLVIGLLHHLPDHAANNVVKEASRILKPRGKALVVEDIPTRSNLNLLGKVVHSLDRGSFIRKEEEYRRLFQKHFTIDKSYIMRSGVCDYQVFCLQS
jgi:ubiquinone/menaquinone biosynthesis C-methylase UbiE